jgi:hypothetical protein
VRIGAVVGESLAGVAHGANRFWLVLAGAITAYVAGPLSGLSMSELSDLLILSNATLGLSLAVAGWPIAAYCPDIRIGWLLLGGGANVRLDRRWSGVAEVSPTPVAGQSAVAPRGG